MAPVLEPVNVVLYAVDTHVALNRQFPDAEEGCFLGRREPLLWGFSGFFWGFLWLFAFFLGRFLGMAPLFIFLLQKGGPVEGNDEQIPDFAENHIGRIFKDQGHTAAPGFHHFNAAK